MKYVKPITIILYKLKNNVTQFTIYKTMPVSAQYQKPKYGATKKQNKKHR